MKKIGVFSDTHGNFLAMRAIVDKFRQLQCDEIIHTGDIVSMGPRSKECLDYLLNSEVTLINGNHDINYINNDTTPPLLSHVPKEHKEYVFNSIGENYRNRMRYLPLIVYREFFNVRLAFLHYGLSKKEIYKHYTFEPINPNPDKEYFDQLFDGINADAVFFGHKHEPIDLVGKKTYVDVGSVGCHEKPKARGVVITVNETGFNYERIEVDYDRDQVGIDIFEQNMPFGEQIWNFYFKETLNHK